MNIELITKYLPKIYNGAILTVELTSVSVVCGLLLAIPLAFLALSQNKLINFLPRSYIFFIRGTPLILQLFLIYYGIAQFAVIKDSFLWFYIRDAYKCALIVMTFNTTAYIAEIIKGAIVSIPIGDKEAAYALGMSPAQTFIHILLPMAFRSILPAYSNEVIFMLKASSLSSTITLLELTGATRTVIARTYMAFEFFSIAALIYLLITLILVGIFKLLEHYLHIHT